MNTDCPLCGKPAGEPFFSDGRRSYHHCPACDLRFLAPADRVSPDREKARYLLHENDANDPGYRNFVQPLVDEIARCVPKGAAGLDFGAGPTPVATVMLTEAGYTMRMYDPFFHPDRTSLDRKYDFVVICESAEHFHDPRSEFQKLKNLLVEGGVLGVMTCLWDASIEFAGWHYRSDPTHTTFYSETAFRWIANHLGFADVCFSGPRVIMLKA